MQWTSDSKPLKNLIKKAYSPVGAQYAAAAVTAIAGFLFMYILTTNGSIEIYGQYLALLAASSLLSNLIGMRTNEAIVRFFRESRFTSEVNKQSEVLFLGLLVDMVLASLLFGLFAVFADEIATYLLKNPTLEAAVYSYGFYVFIVAASGTVNGYLIAADKIVEHALIQIGSSMTKIIGLFIVISFADELSLFHVVSTLAISAFVLILPLCLVVPLIFSGASRVKFLRDRELISDFVSFSIRTFSSTFLKAGNRKIDEFTIATFVDPQALGLYGLIKQFFVPLSFLTTPLATVWYPRFVDAVSEGGRNLLSLIRHVNSRAIVLLSGVTALLIVFNLIYLKFIGVGLDLVNASIVVLCSGAAFLQALQWWARPFSNAVDPMISIRINFSATLLSIFILMPTIYYFGIFGAAVSSFLIALFVVFYWRYHLVLYLRSI